MLALPPIARALNFDIFSVIDSTISEDIGGALSSLNSIQSTLQREEQQVLFPLSLINQAHGYVNTVMTSYRSWMTNVFTLRINSAQLPGSQQLEQSFLSGSFASVGNLGSFYNTAYGTLPNATAAPLAHRQMMDMDDALAKDALAQSVASDQVSSGLIKDCEPDPEGRRREHRAPERRTCSPPAPGRQSSRAWPASTNCLRRCYAKRLERWHTATA